MSELILHHYSGSPYARKIRAILGYKRLPWRSVEIPVTPPRPSLAPVLAGFRRTPVLQIGMVVEAAAEPSDRGQSGVDSISCAILV